MIRHATVGLLIAGCALNAQQIMPLTLKEAHELALKNHPQIQAAQYTAQAAGEVVKETRSAYQPTVFGSFTGVGADSGSRIAAGALNNPVIYNRVGVGLTVGQMVTDFGRTSNLVGSARLRAQSRDQNIETARADVLLRVDQAYFAALRSQALVRVAEQTVGARQLVVDQITALVNSKLKSQLDLSFANVNLSDSKLLFLRAQNELKASSAQLAAALGMQGGQSFALAEEPMQSTVASDLSALIQEGISKRPELAGLRLDQLAAERDVKAERALNFPTISAIATAGVVPAGDFMVPNRYGAVGVNVNIPVFNGGLFAARRAEAELNAKATENTLKDSQLRIERDIRIAYLNAQTAFERIAVTDQLLAQARMGLDLAEGRYQLGLGSAVELSQAQLNLTSAQIASTTARYDYQSERSQLAYQIGVLR